MIVLQITSTRFRSTQNVETSYLKCILEHAHSTDERKKWANQWNWGSGLACEKICRMIKDDCYWLMGLQRAALWTGSANYMSQPNLRSKQWSDMIGWTMSKAQQPLSPKSLWRAACKPVNFPIFSSPLEIIQCATKCNTMNIFHFCTNYNPISFSVS